VEVIELGCGTAYFGAWLKKHGAARVVGVDITPAQLQTAQR
jgi:predicted RNA methylase